MDDKGIASSQFRILLSNEFSDKKSKNPQYSLRAFARDLGINKSTLSDLLSNKTGLSFKTKETLTKALCLSPKQVNLLKNKKIDEYTQIIEDEFRLIADWYYFAILSLAKIKNSKYDPAWVSERIGIKKTEAKRALEKLSKLKLIENKKGSIKRTNKKITTTEDVSSSALKIHHKQNFMRAEKSLMHTDISMREVSSVTMAIDPLKIDEAKVLIRDLRGKVSALLETKNASEVYTFAVQLFPQTQLTIGDQYE